MIHKKIELQARSVGKINSAENGSAERFVPSITTYIIENSAEIDVDRRRPMVVICPGGAYTFKSFREAEPVALKMVSLGFNSCILDYSVAPMDFPAAFMDLCEAVYYIRKHAEELNTDANKIIVCGFSAGGHLAASLGVWWNTDIVSKYLPYSNIDIRPNALMLGYPVITSGEFAHKESIQNVLGTEYGNAELMDLVSLEKHVTSDVPPTFIWHTADDNCVPVQNSIMFVSELAAKGVVFESHIFKSGNHGLSLATEETASNPAQVNIECAVWPLMFQSFVKKYFA